MKNMKFCKNWNGKLRNRVFTTIRKHKGAEDYYGPKIGSVYNIFLRNDIVASARLFEAQLKPFSEIPDLLLMLDTGTSTPEAARAIFEGFYGPIAPHDLFYILAFDREIKKEGTNYGSLNENREQTVR